MRAIRFEKPILKLHLLVALEHRWRKSRPVVAVKNRKQLLFQDGASEHQLKSCARLPIFVHISVRSIKFSQWEQRVSPLKHIFVLLAHSKCDVRLFSITPKVNLANEKADQKTHLYWR